MKLLVLVAASFLATSAHAQSQEQIDAATAYANNPVQQEMLDSMLSPEGIMAQMGLFGDTVPEDKMDKLAQIISEELAVIRPEMETAMITGMANHFTLDEIEALNEFYSSPHGASAMSKMTPYMQETMASLAPDFARMQTNLAERIQAEMSQ